MPIEDKLGKHVASDLLKRINSGVKKDHEVVLIHWENPTSSYIKNGEEIEKDYKDLYDFFKKENVNYIDMDGTALFKFKATLTEKQILYVLEKNCWLVSEELEVK